MKDGQFFVLERKKECINTGGEKVFPVEVEEVLLENPNIAEACVIGVPDEKWGESIRAVVVLKEGKSVSEAEIIKSVEGKVAGFKKPRSVVFTKELPISPVGKILRAKIRELYGAAAEIKPRK